MENIVYVLFISVMVPLSLMVILIEKKAKIPMLFFMVGIFVSVMVSEINGILYNNLDLSLREFTLIVTPITEEIIKMLPILLFAVVISDKKETIFTISLATGIGFAVLENIFILFKFSETINVFSSLIRGFGTGLMHGMCTLIVGYGISFVRKKKKIFFPCTFALLSVAITYHSIFNMLVESRLRIVASILPIMTYLPFFVKRNIVDVRKNKKLAKNKT